MNKESTARSVTTAMLEHLKVGQSAYIEYNHGRELVPMYRNKTLKDKKFSQKKTYAIDEESLVIIPLMKVTRVV